MASDQPSIAKLDEVSAINPRRKVKKGEAVPFIEMAALPTNGRDISVVDIQTRLAKGAGSHFKNGDTLLARITPCLENGKTAQVKSLESGVVGEGSTEFIVLCGQVFEDNEFIYYLTRSVNFRDFAIARMEGTSGRQRVAWQSIASYEFILPSPAIRREAASFLAKLDDRIDNLRQTNTTLEAIAQALFKSWFVDFDPVRAKAEGREPEGMDAATAALFPGEFEDSELGPIPKGWNACALNEALEVNPRRELKKGSVAPYLDMASVPTVGFIPMEPIQREFSSGSKFTNGDTLLARITPCLENGKTAYVNCLENGQVGWGSTEFIVLRPTLPLPSFFAYLLARRFDFRAHAIQSMSGTSGRQRIELTRLNDFPVTVPDEAIANAFADIVAPIEKAISANAKHADCLAETRNTLLPRLISGRVRLRAVEVATKERFA